MNETIVFDIAMQNSDSNDKFFYVLQNRSRKTHKEVSKEYRLLRVRKKYEGKNQGIFFFNRLYYSNFFIAVISKAFISIDERRNT